jgi:signal peptidase II
VCTYNTGSAFGLFQQHTNILILASIVGLGVLFYIYWAYYMPRSLFRISLGLQLGGAFGNLLDRVLYGRVTDFIKIGPWPVFNVADSAVVVGMIILVWLLAFPSRKAKERTSINELFARSKIYGKFP